MTAERIAFVVASFALAYFVLLNVLYLAFTLIASRELARHLRAQRFASVDELLASPLTPGISVIVPAYNEEASIVESVLSLLAIRYPRYEIVVVNDGSTDATLARLTEAFALVPIRKALRTRIPTAAVRGAYVSRRHPNLHVLDKENGGKADALNAGVNASEHPYVAAIDADAVLEQDALVRVVRPVVDDPELVVATGGIVRIANGCKIDRGRVVDVGLPRSRLATMQVVEYFRAFLVGRVGWSRINALLIISGAFGLFRRSAIEDVGGYATDTVGEDVELVVRLHRRLRERGEPYRIAFVPDPVCWTESPEELRVLARQRRRWHRGLGQTLWRHRRLTANPRYGTLGGIAMPYFLLFEFLGPLVELLGPPAVVAFWALGLLSPTFFLSFLVVAFLVATLLSVAALALEEFSFQRHARTRDALRLLVYAVAENFGYRQLVAFWRFVAFFDLARRTTGWGEMRRRGFRTMDEAPLPASGPAAAASAGRESPAPASSAPAD